MLNTDFSKEDFEYYREIAGTILQQLGGNVFKLMTGAHGFRVIERGMSFELHADYPESKVDRVEVRLTPDDMYELSFFKEGQEVQTVDGIFCFQLIPAFERATGLFAHA